MMNIIRNKVKLVCVIAFVLLFGGAGFPVSLNKTTIYKVIIQHPGKEKTDDFLLHLVEIKDQSGLTISYSMKVPSVYCKDVVCKIDSVELFWDIMGRYKGFKIKEGTGLEKSQGESFTKSDYEKLHSILSDPFSSLKDLKLKNVEDEVHYVDAVTGATTLDDNSIVKGALWTSYTLWHFVYGNAVKQMIDISTSSIDNAHLQSFLKDSTESYKVFALDVSKQRREYDELVIRNVIEQTQSCKLNIQNALSYFENSTIEIYLSSIFKVYSSGNSYQRIQCLNSLNNANFDISQEYFFKLIQISVKSISYQEINHLLNVFENRKYNSPQLNSLLFSLMDTDNKLIARRVYWYLSNQELKEFEAIKLNSFKSKNKDML